MLSTRLEKAVLAGWATYRTFNHAYSSFGSLQIPKGHLAIVCSVKWNHFLNPIPSRSSELPSLSELNKYNEYQLKIDGKKSTNFLIFRNINNFKITNPSLSVDITTPLNASDFKKYFLPIASPPIQQDVYFVCEEYINITISRNTFINKIQTDFKPLNPVAAQTPIPTGIANENVLCTETAQNTIGQKYTYTPVLYPNAKPVTIPVDAQNMETYTQPIGKDSLLDNLAENSDRINYTTPLIELGVVIFNKNYFDKIMNG